MKVRDQISSVLLLLDGPEDPLPEDVDGVGDAHPPGASPQVPGLQVLHLTVPELLQSQRGQVVLASSVQRQESLLKFLMSFKRKACYNSTTGMLLSQVRSSALSSLSPSPHFVEWRLRPWSLLRGGRSKLFHLIILLNKTAFRKEMKDLKNAN